MKTASFAVFAFSAMRYRKMTIVGNAAYDVSAERLPQKKTFTGQCLEKEAAPAKVFLAH